MERGCCLWGIQHWQELLSQSEVNLELPACQLLISRLTGQVRSSTHMDGYRVNQELVLTALTMAYRISRISRLMPSL